MTTRPLGRREFLTVAAAVSAAAMTGAPPADAKSPRLKKAVKYGMVRSTGSHRDKLELVKKCGFLGVEINSPGTADLDDLVKASRETGVAVHGVVDSVHWKDTLSHPDEKVRAAGLEALKGALRDAKAVGADTVLLVPGVVNKDVTFAQCKERSQAEVRKVIPLAEQLGVKIAIEVVWNNFITTPDQLIEYVDDFKTPTVGAYFDCSNMLKYGVPSAEWIRRLGKRMLKFDFKAYSKAKAKAAGNEGAGFKAEIGEGDEDWPAVLKALDEVGYHGWATAEVAGGGEDYLKKISAQMDKVLGLQK